MLRLATTLLPLLLLAPRAAATEVAVQAGAGPRFSDAGVDAVGVAHLSVEVTEMLHLSLDLNTYLGGAAPVAFAGGDLGLLFQPPIPGPVGLQVGLKAALANRTRERHGTDDPLLALSGELAATATFGAFQLRVAYQHLLASPSEDYAAVYQSQLLGMLGATF